jgi:hypothetical protein
MVMATLVLQTVNVNPATAPTWICSITIYKKEQKIISHIKKRSRSRIALQLRLSTTIWHRPLNTLSDELY